MAEQERTEEEKKRMEGTIQRLVNVAFERGVVYAIAEARALRDPYVLDAFHDVLVDRLYEELITRKQLDKLR